jgi:hypothetical protein
MKKAFTTGLMLLAISGAISLSFAQEPAQAVISDPAVYNELQDQRNDLLQRESQLLRDRDDLNRQIDNLKRRNDPKLRPLLNDLCKSLDAKYSQLLQTRAEIRDVEGSMI